MAEPIDWGLALATGVRTAGRGPQLTREEAAHEVAALRASAERAKAPVAAVTGLRAPLGGAPAEVVDRQEWIRSTTASLQSLIGPITPALDAGPVQAVSSRVAGLQLGLAFGWLSGKILGQYEALHVAGQGPRLLLLAPNIVAAADSMEVDREVFGMWVCLHEETHRVQFTAVPWLAGYFEESARAIVSGLDASPGELLSRVARGIREGGAGGPASWLQSPEVRVRMDAMVGLMSLLEGHADWVMDSADGVVPIAPELRSKFEQRRKASGLIDGVIRKLLGLDAKMAQYRDGAAFVRAVVAEVGVDGFNRVWEAPDTLPTLAEIHDPGAWVARVHSRPVGW